LGAGAGRSIRKALTVNRVLITLDLEYKDIGTKGARKIGPALHVNRALSTILLNSNNALAGEIGGLVAVKRALDAKLRL
jgi:hypothetical protein